MIHQPALDFETSLPISGRTLQSRHSSATGAIYAAKTRGQQTLTYLALLDACGPLSDHEAARRMGVGVSSINSIRGNLESQIEACGYQVVTWPDGRTTKRTRWRKR